MIMIDVEGDDSYVGDSMTMATITMLLWYYSDCDALSIIH